MYEINIDVEVYFTVVLLLELHIIGVLPEKRFCYVPHYIGDKILCFLVSLDNYENCFFLFIFKIRTNFFLVLS